MGVYHLSPHHHNSAPAQGKSIDAFINNKNVLNCEERGEEVVGKVSKQVFLKAFEIFLHATQYNPKDAFGCNKCPEELLKGESEEDFKDIKEVHIRMCTHQRVCLNETSSKFPK